MNEYGQEDRELARRVALRLSAGARDVDDRIAQRLRLAREAALAAHRPAPASRWLARVRIGIEGLVAPALRPAALAVALLALVLAGDHWAMLSRVDSLQDVDMALLIDDLPIDAYLDTDFREWLREDSRS